MPTPLKVENQLFEFGDEWSIAFKYDDTNFHQKEATKLQGMIEGVRHSTKAVDVVALHKVWGLLLLEAKDFRGHRIANKPRVEGEVSVELAMKARDVLPYENVEYQWIPRAENSRADALLNMVLDSRTI